MAFKHQGWQTVNKTGKPEWERLAELADGTRTTSDIKEIINIEYGDNKTTDAIRKKLTRMSLDWRKPHSRITSVAVITEPRVKTEEHTTDKDTIALVVNDLQCPYHNEDAVALVLKFANEELKPDETYMNGDIYDCYPISKFEKLRERGEHWSLVQEVAISTVVKEAFENINSNKRVWYMGGNHEDRLRRYLIGKAPELIGIPSVNIPDIFGFDERSYYPYNSHEMHVRNNLLITHGDIIRKHSGYTARAHVEKYGMSVLHGHSHRGGSYFVRRYGQQLAGYENFCLCNLDPNWKVHPNWQNGFAVVFFSKNNRRFYVQPVPITGGGFLWEGRRWSYADLTEEDYSRIDTSYYE